MACESGGNLQQVPVVLAMAPSLWLQLAAVWCSSMRLPVERPLQPPMQPHLCAGPLLEAGLAALLAAWQ
jgi:hypothetical protein